MLRDVHAPGCRFFSYFPQIFPRFSQIFPVAGFLGCPRRERTTGSPSLFKNNLYTVVFPCPPLQVEHFFSISFYSHCLFVFSFCLFFFCFSIFCSFIRLNRGVHDKKGNQASNVSPNFFLFNTRGGGGWIFRQYLYSGHRNIRENVLRSSITKKKKLHISCLLMKV